MHIKSTHPNTSEPFDDSRWLYLCELKVSHFVITCSMRSCLKCLLCSTAYQLLGSIEDTRDVYLWPI